ncbi:MULTISPECIES: hypothetical protein [Nostoc]|uniref:Uncharacterized protein n=1 Tax=Nostoc paludosum FACHB-159 TaxID=2692908 RepID=A0ABR8KJU6_9NOSO|nr:MULTISPECIES: hypothetical protein [Nostoc]MBD2682719.1 hypothetical protein [Nostoc sp. FACHB-857]MBD2739053.1 hypothetical protein [Nostoc paludosum FACHB-159]
MFSIKELQQNLEWATPRYANKIQNLAGKFYCLLGAIAQLVRVCERLALPMPRAKETSESKTELMPDFGI